MPDLHRLTLLVGLFGLALLASCAAQNSSADAPATDASFPADRSSATSAPTAHSGAPPTTAAPPSSTTTSMPRDPITLGFAGDTAFTDGLHDRDPFGQVGDLLRQPDLMVVNLETAVADADVGRPLVAKRFLFKSPPESLGLLVDAGVDAVALANNHTLDFGPDGLTQTLEEIDAAGLLRVGAGLDQDEAYKPLVVDVGQWKVGLVSLSRVPCDWSASGENVRPQVAWACPPFLPLADQMVASTLAEADVTVVMVHGGEEGVLCPSDFMVELEQRWADMGVTAVINGHPHVLQGITSWGETMIVHSTGNFAFPSARGMTANSAVFLLDVTEDGIRLRAEPVRAQGGVLAQPSEEQRISILEQMNRVSSGWRFDSTGEARRSDDVGDC